MVRLPLHISLIFIPCFDHKKAIENISGDYTRHHCWHHKLNRYYRKDGLNIYLTTSFVGTLIAILSYSLVTQGSNNKCYLVNQTYSKSTFGRFNHNLILNLTVKQDCWLYYGMDKSTRRMVPALRSANLSLYRAI